MRKVTFYIFNTLSIIWAITALLQINSIVKGEYVISMIISLLTLIMATLFDIKSKLDAD